MSAACSHEDPVERIVADAVQAAEDQDADDFAKLLSPDFRGTGDAGKGEVVSMVKRYLAAYDTLDIGVSNLEVSREGTFARATFRVRLTGVGTKFGGLGDLVPKNANYDIELNLREADSGWLITQASWAEAGR